MPVRQKTFRIEQMTSGQEPQSAGSNGAGSTLLHHEVLTELKALREQASAETHGAVLAAKK